MGDACVGVQLLAGTLLARMTSEKRMPTVYTVCYVCGGPDAIAQAARNGTHVCYVLAPYRAEDAPGLHASAEAAVYGAWDGVTMRIAQHAKMRARPFFDGPCDSFIIYMGGGGPSRR